MGVFSSGTEGMDYQLNYCEDCANFKGYGDPDGCPVWQLHELFMGVRCKEGDGLVPLFSGAKNGDRWHGPTAKAFLDSLIPTTADGVHNRECALFFLRLKGHPCPTCGSEHDKCNDPRHPCGCGEPLWKHTGGRCPQPKADDDA